MATILHIMATRHKKITIDIFLLANNYHSIEGSDMESGNVRYLTEKIKSDWEKINKKIISNGHGSIDVCSVTSIEDAEDLAYLALYTESEIRKKYLLVDAMPRYWKDSKDEDGDIDEILSEP